MGTGTLTIDAGTTVESDGAATGGVRNPVVVNGNFTFGGSVAANSLILSGPMNLGSVARTITVTNPLVTGTLGGIVSGTGGLTKAGKRHPGAQWRQ